MQYSAEDRDLAIRTIIGEEASLAGQAGVAAVILNRLAQGGYGDTLGDVVLSPGQFEPWSRNPGDLLRISQSDPRYVRAGQILDAVRSGEIADPTGGATHFYAPKAQAALGRSAPAWAQGDGKLLGSTMFYAPNGAVDRKIDATPQMREGLKTLGAERETAALTGGLKAEGERRAGAATISAAPAAPGSTPSDIPNRPPAFMKSATLDVGVQAPDRPPNFMKGATRFVEPAPPVFGGGEGIAPSAMPPAFQRLPGALVETGKDILGGVGRAVTLPGDVAQGKVDPLSQEAIERSTDLAGMVTLGAGHAPAAPGGIAIGATEDAARAAEEAMRGVGRPPEELKPQPVQRDVASRAQPSAPGEVEFVQNPDGSWSMRRSDGTTEPARPPAFMQDAKPEPPPAAAKPADELTYTSTEEPKPKSVGAAAAPGQPLPEVPTRETIWEQEDRFNRLRKSVDADRSELMRRIDAMPPEVRNTETQQRFYRHMEDPNFPLTPEEKRLYDEYIAPLKREERDLYEEAKKTDLEGLADYDPTYAHRIVKGKAPHFDQVLGNSEPDPMGPIGGRRGLPQTTSSMKDRVFFAIQDAATGERKIVARGKDGGLSILENGKFSPLKSDQELKPGDAFHYDGKLWTFEQARAREITAAGGPEYYENAVANTIDNVARLRQVVRAIHEVERLKSSPEWEQYAKPFDAKDVPRDWVEPKMPLFRGWKVQPKLAAAIDDFYGAGGEIFDKLAKINRFAVGTMFWSPVRHIYNVATHWMTARGWDNVTPHGMASLAADGFNAVREVVGQGPKYQALLREGNGLIYSSVANQRFYEKMLRRLGEDVVKNPSKWDPIARTLGVGPSDLVKMIYGASSRTLWAVSDMMMMQRVLELERKGMSLRDAIKEAERHIPPYRTYTEILGSRLASQIYFHPALTEFSRYHYGMLNSWANVIKDLTLGGKNPLGQSRRVEATGNLLVTAAAMTFIAPLVNAAFQAMLGPNVRVNAPGSFTLPAPMLDKAMQGDWAKKHLPKYVLDYYNGDTSFLNTAMNLFALAPITRAGVEAVGNVDLFTHRNIVEPSDVEHGRVGRVAGQLAEHFGEKAVQPYYALNRMLAQGKSVPRGTLEQILGLSEPNRGGLAKVRRRQEREAERRAARPPGFIEGLFARLPF